MMAIRSGLVTFDQLKDVYHFLMKYSLEVKSRVTIQLTRNNVLRATIQKNDEYFYYGLMSAYSQASN